MLSTELKKPDYITRPLHQSLASRVAGNPACALFVKAAALLEPAKDTRQLPGRVESACKGLHAPAPRKAELDWRPAAASLTFEPGSAPGRTALAAGAPAKAQAWQGGLWQGQRPSGLAGRLCQSRGPGLGAALRAVEAGDGRKLAV